MQFDQQKAYELWNEINSLTIQVSKLKESFARLIEPPNTTNRKNELSKTALMKPVRRSEKHVNKVSIN